MPEKKSSSSVTRLRREPASGGIITLPNLNPSDSIALSTKDTSPIMTRGRRTGKKSLIKSLRHRLSATARSLSLEQHLCKDHQKTNTLGNGSSPKTEYQQRSISSDRGRSLMELRTGASILNVPNFGDDGSSQSDLSGISNVSNRTYLNEESSLILECTENGIKRAYLVPYEMAKQGKLRRKGVKLHVYMDHIFVAKHVKGGTICEVCQSSIPIRLGKQGYVCRDCSLVCHKTCHVRVENHCTETSLPAMEIECYNDSEFLRLNRQDDSDNGLAPA